MALDEIKELCKTKDFGCNVFEKAQISSKEGYYIFEVNLTDKSYRAFLDEKADEIEGYQELKDLLKKSGYRRF